jgi:hypothetical protein
MELDRDGTGHLCAFMHTSEKTIPHRWKQERPSKTIGDHEATKAVGRACARSTVFVGVSVVSLLALLDTLTTTIP